MVLRRLASVLAVVILVLPVAHAVEDRTETRQKLREFNEAYQQENWQRAIELGLELDRRLAERALMRYNLACVYARNGDAESSVLWLSKATESGFYRLEHLESDVDLDGVREDPGYKAVLEAVAENQGRRERAIRRAFDASPPRVATPRRHDPEKPSPLVIALHGYGDRPDGYPDAWRGAASKVDAILAAPRGLNPVGNGWGWSDVDEANTILQLTLEYVREKHAIDDRQIVLTGFSQGGFMAMALGIRHSDLFAGVIPMAGGYIPEIDAPPEATGDGDSRYFFMVGELDDAADQVRVAADAFSAAGYEVKLRVYPNAGHTFPRDKTRELTKALRFALGR